MRRILITGMSAVGKSTVIEVLRRRGHKAVDLDSPEWSEYGHVNDDHATDPESEWLWREDRVDDLLSSEDADVLFVSGCARNQGQFYPLFDRVILLTASEAVTKGRLAARTNNEFGKTVEEVSKILTDKEEFEERLREGADVVISTDELALNTVVERVLQTIGGTT